MLIIMIAKKRAIFPTITAKTPNTRRTGITKAARFPLIKGLPLRNSRPRKNKITTRMINEKSLMEKFNLTEKEKTIL